MKSLRLARWIVLVALLIAFSISVCAYAKPRPPRPIDEQDGIDEWPTGVPDGKSTVLLDRSQQLPPSCIAECGGLDFLLD